MKPKIGVITHYSAFQEQFSELADEMNCELLFSTGVLDYAIATGIDMEKNEGVDAIISHEKTSETIAPYLKIPVLSLHIKDTNLFSAFYKCRQMGERIAFVDFEKDVIHYNVNQIKEILGYDINWYKFSDLKKLPEVLDRILQDQRDVIATTASCMYGYAKSRNLNVVLIEHQKQDLVTVIQHTMDILKVKRQEEEKFRWLGAVVENTDDGFITLDRNNIITSANRAAECTLLFSANELIGQEAQALCVLNPALKKTIQSGDDINFIDHNGQELVISKREIVFKDSYLGSLLKVDVLKNIQHIEMHSRKKASPSGFVAANTFDDIIGISRTIQKVIERAKSYAATNSHILITGESGTGKEIFAQSIHNYSSWQNGPFVAINCASLPENLLDSELFGYEDGAFTGAKKGGKAGLFELAHGGTLFLDEIGEMPLTLQAKVLRVLQEKEVRRIGGTKNNPINVRFIFATNRDLYQETLNNNFRKDLYYRVNVLSLVIPPLRERIEDVPPIAAHLAARLAVDHSRPTGFTPDQLEKLKWYSWPGNVRELQNFAERVIAVGPSDPVFDTMLSETIAQTDKENAHAPTVKCADNNSLVVPIGTMYEMENHIIASLNKMYEGDRKKLGYTLNLCNTTLWRRLKETKPSAQ